MTFNLVVIFEWSLVFFLLLLFFNYKYQRLVDDGLTILLVFEQTIILEGVFLFRFVFYKDTTSRNWKVANNSLKFLQDFQETKKEKQGSIPGSIYISCNFFFSIFISRQILVNTIFLVCWVQSCHDFHLITFSKQKKKYNNEELSLHNSWKCLSVRRTAEDVIYKLEMPKIEQVQKFKCLGKCFKRGKKTWQ